MLTHAPVENLYVCDGCECTVLATKRALYMRWHWKRYAGDAWELVLCPDCQPSK